MRASVVIPLLSLILIGAAPRPGAAQVLQPGTIVEVSAYGAWDTVGKVLKVDEYGVLVLYRGPDGGYDERVGFTRYFEAKDVRPFAEAAAQTTPEAEGAPPPGTGLMTQAEILGYLQERIGDNPWTHPQKPQVVEALAAEIRSRGVDFLDEALSDFSDQLRNSGGNESTIPNAIGYNFGPPTAPDWYLGSWDMVIIGSPVDYNVGQEVRRQGEIGARGGAIQVAADGGYVWKLYAGDPPSAYVRGRWRPATAEEMRYQGGAGIVLLAGKSGDDWLMREDRTSDAGGDDMVVSLVSSWAQREFGTRGGR